MTHHYCTYFDRGYLAQGLALWASLVRHEPDAILWVLALDDETAAVLRAQGTPSLRIIPIEQVLAADPTLAAVRDRRTRSEFIFTLTPCLILHLFRREAGLELIVYLDADLCFFGPPDPVFEELGGGSVLVVPHRYPPWHDDSSRYGRYNVGVLAFRNDDHGRGCLHWWRARCLESCALTADGVHYGDQKYLDAWPERFHGVVESRHPGLNVAPWNWARHRFDLRPEGVFVDGVRLVVFHFAQFRTISAGWFDSGQLEYGIMPIRLRSRLYGAYWDALCAAERAMQVSWPEFRIVRRGWRASLGPIHLALLRLFWGQFWWRHGRWWFAGRFGLGRFSGRAMAVYRRMRRGTQP